MSYKDLKIGKKLALGFGVVLLLLAGITAVGVVNMAALNAGTEQIVKKEWVKARLSIKALDNVRGSAARVLQITAQTDDKETAKAQESLAASIKAFSDAFAELEPMLYLPEGKRLLARCRESAAKYIGEVDKVLALVKEGKRDDASAKAFGDTYAASHVLAADARAVLELQEKLLDKRGAESAATYAFARMWMIGLGILALVLGARGRGSWHVRSRYRSRPRSRLHRRWRPAT